MTQEEAERIISTKHDSWSMRPKDGFEKYYYEHRECGSNKPFKKYTIFCDSKEFFHEFIEACNTKVDWDDYRVYGAPLKEEDGQLLMF